MCKTPLLGAMVVNPACSMTRPQRATQAWMPFGQFAVEHDPVDEFRLVRSLTISVTTIGIAARQAELKVIDQRQGLGRVFDPVDHVDPHLVNQTVGGHHFLIGQDQGDRAHGRLPCLMHEGNEPVEARLKLLDDSSPAEQDPALAGLNHDAERPCHAIKPRRDGPGVLLGLLQQAFARPISGSSTTRIHRLFSVIGTGL